MRGNRVRGRQGVMLALLIVLVSLLPANGARGRALDPLPAVVATRTVSGTVSGPVPAPPLALLTADFVTRTRGFLARQRNGPCTGAACHPSLLTTANGGQGWQQISSGIAFSDLSFVSPARGYGVTLGGALLRTHDGGRHWSAVTIPAAASWVDFAAPGRGWLVAGPAVYRTGSSGRGWQELPFRCGSFQSVARVSFVNRRTGFLLCRQDNGPFAVTLYRSDNAGTSWQKVSTVDPAAHALGAFDFPSPRLGFVSAGFGNLLRTTDGGHTFRPVPGTPFEDVLAASWFGPSTGYVDSYRALMRTTDGGAHWQQIYPALQPQGPIALTASGAGLGADTSWFPGAILRSRNGLDWQSVAQLPAISELLRISARTVWAVAPVESSTFPVQVWRTNDNGTHWQRVLSVPGGSGTLSFAGQQLGFLATNSLYVTANGGRTWSPRSESIDTWDDQFVSATTGWAFGSSSPIVYTRDGGRSWQGVAVRVPYLRPGALYFLNSRDGWISGNVCPPSAPCVPALLRTRDGGASWLLIRLPQSFASNGFDWVNPEVGYVLLNGVLYRTRDGGVHWQGVSGSGSGGWRGRG